PQAPDVLDMGKAVTLANTELYAPYKVQTWNDIPDSQKESTGLYVQDYGGYMAIGYDSAKVPAVTSLQDLLGSGFRGKVALNGDPTKANAALNGVMMASIANGGSADDISKGVDFFHPAINKNAPHPAAARLWEEYVFSDVGQNFWLKGLARPVRMAAMQASGKIDSAAAAKLPPVNGTPVFLTDAQATKAKDYLA